MEINTSRSRVAEDAPGLARLEELLGDYPHLTAPAREEIGQRLRGLGPLDTGLLSANAAAWKQAERYRSDHPHLFRTGWKGHLLWIGLVLATILILYLLWDVAVD